MRYDAKDVLSCGMMFQRVFLLWRKKISWHLLTYYIFLSIYPHMCLQSLITMYCNSSLAAWSCVKKEIHQVSSLDLLFNIVERIVIRTRPHCVNSPKMNQIICSPKTHIIVYHFHFIIIVGYFWYFIICYFEMWTRKELLLANQHHLPWLQGPYNIATHLNSHVNVMF